MTLTFYKFKETRKPALIILVLLVSLTPTLTRAKCAPCENLKISNASVYQTVVKYHEADGTFVMHVVAEHSHFGRDDMLELACRFHRDFAGEKKLFILVFDQKTAAKKYVPPSARHKPSDWANYARSFRAFYSWNEGSAHWIVWGFDPLLEVSKIDSTQYSTIDICLNP